MHLDTEAVRKRRDDYLKERYDLFTEISKDDVEDSIWKKLVSNLKLDETNQKCFEKDPDNRGRQRRRVLDRYAV